MVDSISGAGAPQNVFQIKNNQNQRANARGASEAPAAAAGDEVSLSSEAQALADVDALTAQVREGLSGNSETLSGDGQRLDVLL